MSTNPPENVPEVASHALLEVFCFDFSARPVPTDSYYVRNIYDSIPVKITAATRDDAERIALQALGKPKERLDCKWTLTLLSVHSSNATAQLPPRSGSNSKQDASGG